jgi:hypothetical protein
MQNVTITIQHILLELDRGAKRSKRERIGPDGKNWQFFFKKGPIFS